MTDAELIERLQTGATWDDDVAAANRIEALTAERDEVINQLDSVIHSQIVLGKRTAAVMEDRALILAERDRTFALMLARAEKAEADNSRLRDAIDYILDGMGIYEPYYTSSTLMMTFWMPQTQNG